jgi:hypothetical protein
VAQLRTTQGDGAFDLSRTRRAPRVTLFAHRIAYLLAFGELDDSLVIHHTCENKLCVNPRHLLAMSLADHSRLHYDYESIRYERVIKEVCPRGHVKDGVYRGYRYCRECDRIRHRKEVTENAL